MIGLYALEENIEMAAFADGLRAASLRYKYRNHNVFTPDQVEDFDIVVVAGLRDKGMVIKDCYQVLGVPVIVIDYGYMRRVSGVADFYTGHWQVGLNRLNWVPAFSCPADRFDALGVPIRNRIKRGNTILVCGQYSGDPSHGLTDQQMIDWAENQIKTAKQNHPDAQVLWRPHPKMDRAFDVHGHDGISAGEINWDGVHSLVCINSNIGHEALLNGVPVSCRDDAPYASLIDAQTQTQYDRRVEYFNRLAYAQWTLEEMRSGKAIEFILTAIRNDQCQKL